MEHRQQKKKQAAQNAANRRAKRRLTSKHKKRISVIATAALKRQANKSMLERKLQAAKRKKDAKS